MQPSSPTTLITPSPAQTTPTQGFLISPALSISFVVVAATFLAVLAYRRRQHQDPCELAFRTLSRKLGLTSNQITQIRSCATSMGLSTPLGIIVSPELCSRALDGNSQA